MTPLKAELRIRLSELRVKVAEAIGWKHTGRASGIMIRPEPRNPGELTYDYPPDYSSDLNLCAELRASLTEEERDDYMQELHKITAVPCDRGWAAINASANQHCRAFLAVKENK